MIIPLISIFGSKDIELIAVLQSSERFFSYCWQFDRNNYFHQQIIVDGSFLDWISMKKLAECMYECITWKFLVTALKSRQKCWGGEKVGRSKKGQFDVECVMEKCIYAWCSHDDVLLFPAALFRKWVYASVQRKAVSLYEEDHRHGPLLHARSRCLNILRKTTRRYRSLGHNLRSQNGRKSLCYSVRANRVPSVPGVLFCFKDLFFLPQSPSLLTISTQETFSTWMSTTPIVRPVTHVINIHELIRVICIRQLEPPDKYRFAILLFSRVFPPELKFVLEKLETSHRVCCHSPSYRPCCWPNIDFHCPPHLLYSLSSN